jgi:hypothetical protein
MLKDPDYSVGVFVMPGVTRPPSLGRYITQYPYYKERTNMRPVTSNSSEFAKAQILGI